MVLPHFLGLWLADGFLYVALPLWFWLVVVAGNAWLIFRCVRGRHDAR